MAELTNDQLLLLDNLIYLNGVVVEGDEDNTVGSIVNSFLDENGELTYKFC